MSKFRIGDRVKMSALGKERLRCDWIGRIIEIDASQYGDIVRMKIDGKGKSGLMSAEYLELDVSPELSAVAPRMLEALRQIIDLLHIPDIAAEERALLDQLTYSSGAALTIAEQVVEEIQC